LLDRLTHHVHILEMKAKAIGSPRASVGPARRSIRQRQIKKHYQRQRAHRPHNNDRSARALAVKPRLRRAATRVRARPLGATEQIRHPCGE
jgi:hypothetical protein